MPEVFCCFLLMLSLAAFIASSPCRPLQIWTRFKMQLSFADSIRDVVVRASTSFRLEVLHSVIFRSQKTYETRPTVDKPFIYLSQRDTINTETNVYERSHRTVTNVYLQYILIYYFQYISERFWSVSKTLRLSDELQGHEITLTSSWVSSRLLRINVGKELISSRPVWSNAGKELIFTRVVLAWTSTNKEHKLIYHYKSYRCSYSISFPLFRWCIRLPGRERLLTECYVAIVASRLGWCQPLWESLAHLDTCSLNTNVYVCYFYIYFYLHHLIHLNTWHSQRQWYSLWTFLPFIPKRKTSG